MKKNLSIHNIRTSYYTHDLNIGLTKKIDGHNTAWLVKNNEWYFYINYITKEITCNYDNTWRVVELSNSLTSYLEVYDFMKMYVSIVFYLHDFEPKISNDFIVNKWNKITKNGQFTHNNRFIY